MSPAANVAQLKPRQSPALQLLGILAAGHFQTGAVGELDPAVLTVGDDRIGRAVGNHRHGIEGVAMRFRDLFEQLVGRVGDIAHLVTPEYRQSVSIDMGRVVCGGDQIVAQPDQRQQDQAADHDHRDGGDEEGDDEDEANNPPDKSGQGRLNMRRIEPSGEFVGGGEIVWLPQDVEPSAGIGKPARRGDIGGRQLAEAADVFSLPIEKNAAANGRMLFKGSC